MYTTNPQRITLGVYNRARAAGIHPFQAMGFTSTAATTFPFSRPANWYQNWIARRIATTRVVVDADVGLAQRVTTACGRRWLTRTELPRMISTLPSTIRRSTR